MKTGFPVQIHRRQEGSRIRFIAATSLDKLFDGTSTPLEQLKSIQVAYEMTLAAARRALEMAHQDKRVAPHPLWLLADQLKHFTDLLNGMRFYLWKANATFARDLGISQSSVEKLRSFHKRFPDITMVDPMVPWKRYRENKAPPIRG